MKNETLNKKEQTQEKTNLRKIISWILTILVLALMGWYLWKNQEIFKNLKRIGTQDVLLIALLQPINIILGAVINKLIIDQIDQKIPLMDAILLQFTNNFLNRFISEGGAVYRGAYLKTQYAFPISKFLASLGGVYIISLMTNTLLGLFFSFVMYLQFEIINTYLFIAFGAILLGCIFMIVIKPAFKSKKWIFHKINQIVQGWNSIKSNWLLVIKIFFLTAMALLNSSIIVYIVYHGLGWNIKIFNSLFYSTISSIANVINLTPGGLGINEAILMFSSDVIGLSRDIILLGSLLLRAISMITTLSLGVLSYLILNIRLQRPVDRD